MKLSKFDVPASFGLLGIIRFARVFVLASVESDCVPADVSTPVQARRKIRLIEFINHGNSRLICPSLFIAVNPSVQISDINGWLVVIFVNGESSLHYEMSNSLGRSSNVCRYLIVAVEAL